MSRLDSKGNILNQGETERKNGTYSYRYSYLGKRYTVYAKTLDELREKEKTTGELYNPSSITISSMLNRFLLLKNNLRPSTYDVYSRIAERLINEYGDLEINKLKVFDIKRWFVKLQQVDNLSYTTLKLYQTVLKAACRYAVEDEYVNKNIFDFKLDFLRKDRKKIESLTEEQERQLLEYTKTHNIYYYHLTVLLLETGMRIGEACGLQFSDINLTENKNVIKINKQLALNHAIEEMENPKTEKGTREIPVSPKAKEALLYFFANRGDKIKSVDGYNNFVINKSRNTIAQFYNNLKLPFHVFPHMLRHTFCTKLVNKKINPKALQYIMGHSDISTTLGVYTSMTAQNAYEHFEQIL